MSAQKNGLNETVLMSTHNICFGKKKINPLHSGLETCNGHSIKLSEYCPIGMVLLSKHKTYVLDGKLVINL